MTSWWWLVAPIFAWALALILNRFAERIVGIVCRLLPPGDREERRAEWIAELRSSGNPLERLWYSLGLVRCGWAERQRVPATSNLLLRFREEMMDGSPFRLAVFVGAGYGPLAVGGLFVANSANAVLGIVISIAGFVGLAYGFYLVRSLRSARLKRMELRDPSPEHRADQPGST